MAVRPAPEERERSWCEEEVLVTPEAQGHLDPSDIWYHFGGWHDEGDTYETQQVQFQDELDRFWAQVAGPDELLRRNILGPLEGIRPEWKTVIISSDGKVRIRFNDGTEKTIDPPVC